MPLVLQAKEPNEAEKREFFESKIRPVLVEACYDCHNSHTKSKAGLIMDWRGGMLEGGESGPLFDFDQPEKSLLVQVMRHEIPSLRMPKGGPKPEPQVIADFVTWIKNGAFDPRESAPTAEELANETAWETVRERRKQWWCFQPIENPSAPGDQHPVDHFIREKLAEADLSPSSPAPPNVALRRLHLVLTGLPPTVEELKSFKTWEARVDELLASPRFGERWARHWMDWWRYADTHGSEGDPNIPFSHEYRNYLIRALNADVPYDQLLREHLAGDLLPEPRLNPELGINESAIGPAHFRMVFHGFGPTDALDELVRFTDNQIDVVSKATMGLTVSCARCHHHKFDAISQDDFYAMFGIFASARPGIRSVTVDPVPDAERMRQLKQDIRGKVAKAWLAKTDGLVGSEPWKKIALEAKGNDPLHQWKLLQASDDPATSWKHVSQAIAASRERVARRESFELPLADWFVNEEKASPEPAGFFTIPHEGDAAISGPWPSGLYSHGVSTRLGATAQSPRFDIGPKHTLHLRLAGKDARARYVVHNYPRRGVVYPVRTISHDHRGIYTFDLAYWEGENAFAELTTAAHGPVEGNFNADRSWFGIVGAYLTTDKDRNVVHFGDEISLTCGPLAIVDGGEMPDDTDAHYTDTLRAAITAWRDQSMSDEQAEFLRAIVDHGLLPATLEELPVGTEVAAYRKLDAAIRRPTRVPAMLETVAFDQPLYTRGDHKKPAHIVPRRFLEALGGRVYDTELSGREEFAEDILHADNPLTARVIANRVWHHVFGLGLVSTPDNFGRLGEKPTHPELLDALAQKIKADDWSLKAFIKHLVMSETFRQDSTPTTAAIERDPANKLLSHASVRRVEAEAIRDNFIQLAGKLDTRMGGAGEGGQSNRRSVYVKTIRNRLDPLLSTFDAPEPLTTRGRRNVTNVPGQSLALMNNGRVQQLATAWARKLNQISNPEERVRRMFLEAFAREPTPAEIAQSLAFVRGEDLAPKIIEARRQLAEISGQLNELHDERDQIFDQTRQALEEKNGPSKYEPDAIAIWDFTAGLNDRVGKLGGKLVGGARLTPKGLRVANNGHFESDPLPQTIGPKTLEAWVTLATLNDRAGGVMNLQSLNGHTFDAIVFAEQKPHRWLPGSDGFRRTKPVNGPDQTSLEKTHLAITYTENGTITMYRNGEPYGNPYTTSLMRYQANECQVVFGCRHTAGSPNRWLDGTIHQARLYNHALSADEVAASYDGTGITGSAIRAALRDEERTQVSEWGKQISKLQSTAVNLQATLPKHSGRDRWEDLAHAMFNMKEMIYLR